jgi:hypothetical protein
MGFESLESSFGVSHDGFEVGHDETHNWGGRRAIPNPVGVAVDRCHSRCGDRRCCNLIWRFVGHGSTTNGRGVQICSGR